jgi:hypothetical protein
MLRLKAKLETDRGTDTGAVDSATQANLKRQHHLVVAFGGALVIQGARFVGASPTIEDPQ